QSAARLAPGEDVYRELGEARSTAEKARTAAALAAQQQRDKARVNQAQSAQKRIQAERDARAKLDAERSKARAAHEQAVYDNLLAQAKTLRAKKEYEQALAAAQSARKLRTTAETATLVRQLQDDLVLETARKKGEAERRKAEEEQKKRAAALV